MVSYYNPAMAMFSRPGAAHHHHHHHTSPTQNHYFSPAAAAAYSSYHHPHHHHHQTTAAGNPASAAAATVGGVGLSGVSSTQFSPNMATDFNCNHQYHHQFGNMTPDTMAASWHQPMYTACASAARNIPTAYEDWPHQHPPPTHPSFYSHGHNSPPSSTSSPNSTHTTSPTSIYNTSTSFKAEFGPCSGGNSQGITVNSGPNLGGNPHSPDSGMAISDGVSSSNGSPATSGQLSQHCSIGVSNHHISSNGPSSLNNGSLVGSQTNLNVNQQSGRPTQARSPYEWMKKPSYSVNSNNGKTRTKDKYRVVYSDTQRLELEKEFHYSRYITIRRKAELASNLGLSERQVKIWFQNRRAKERKQVRKHEEMMSRGKIMAHMQNAAGMPPVSVGPMCNNPNGVIPAIM